MELALEDHIQGWAWQSDAHTLEVEAVLDGKVIGRARAENYRPDLASRGIGDGRCGFRIALSPPIANPQDVLVRIHEGPVLPRMPRGSIASIGDPNVSLRPRMAIHVEGLVGRKLTGWGWRPAAPTEAIRFEFSIDGDVVGQATAAGFRRDLEVAGIRGGFASFEFLIPERFLDERRHALTVHAPEETWPGYATEFSLAKLVEGPGPRFGAGQVLFPGFAWPQEQPPVHSLAAAAIPVVEWLNVLDHFRAVAPLTVVVTAYNAAAALGTCLESVVTRTTLPVNILVIDDASTDPRIKMLLDELMQRDPRVRTVRNAVNLGYTRSVNLALRETAGDVVLLNSDTVVTTRWLERLCASAYRRGRIGTVTPLSDNAGAFSIPDGGVQNRFPGAYLPDQLARAIAAASPGWSPAVPTGSGFCMLIKRRLIEEVGLFDDVAFPRGYGEENDFCMRALRRGWEHIVDDKVLVLHLRSASFGDEREALTAAGAEWIDKRYPDYRQLTRVFSHSRLLQDARDAARLTLQELRNASAASGAPIATKPRILYLLHDIEDGGTAHTTIDLMGDISSEFACLVLVIRNDAARLLEFNGATLVARGHWNLNQTPGLFADHPTDYAALFASILIREGIELVHVRHLINHSLEAPAIARVLNIPVVLSFHDFYAICPTVNLLDHRGIYCAGRCTPGIGVCPTPIPWPEGLPPLKHTMVHDWRNRVNAMLAHVDAFVTTSDSARALLNEHFPSLAEKGVRVVEHGRNFPKQLELATPPSRDCPTRLLVLGHMTSRHKGADTVKKLHELDSHKRLEIHVSGNVPDEFQTIAKCHGVYKRDALPALVAEIRPSFVFLPASWPETYSHTLSEAWACGVPVIGSNLGAIGERIRRHGGGWTVEPDNAGSILSLVLRLADDPVAYAAEALRARLDNVRLTSEMGQDYRVLYKELLADSLHRAARRMGAPPRCLPIAAVIPRDETDGALLHDRWLNAMRHPVVARLLDCAVITPHALARWSAAPVGRIVVTPALGDGAYADILLKAKAAGLRIICDAALPAASIGSGEVQHLGRFADVLIDADEDPIENYANLLDERPWLQAADRRELSAASPHVDTALPSVVVTLRRMDAREEKMVEELAAAARISGSWHLTLICGVRPTIPLGEAQVLLVPSHVSGKEGLADWLAQALPANAALALAPMARPLVAGEVGAAHWALLGLPCVAVADHPQAAAAVERLSSEPSAWIDRISQIIKGDYMAGADERRKAALAQWSLSDRPAEFRRWLTGANEFESVALESVTPFRANPIGGSV